jgi:hypothetical protein
MSKTRGVEREKLTTGMGRWSLTKCRPCDANMVTRAVDERRKKEARFLTLLHWLRRIHRIMGSRNRRNSGELPGKEVSTRATSTPVRVATPSPSVNK